MGDAAHQFGAQRLDRRIGGGPAPVAQRQRCAKARGSRAEPLVAAADAVPRHPRYEGHDRQGAGAEPPCALPCRLGQQAVFQHAVIGKAHGHKDHVAPCRIETLQDIGQKTHPRRAHAPVQRKPALGKDGLRHALGRRHLDIAGQHPAIQRIARAAPDEIGPHCPDHPRQRPDPRPFAHRIGQRRPVRDQPCHQHVIHVRPVIHHEDHGGFRVDLRQRGIHAADPHAVEHPAQPAGGAGGKAEIDRGRKARHDFARIAAGFLEGDRSGDAAGGGLFGDGLHHLGVMDQPHDHVLPAGQLERLDRAGEAAVQPRNGALHPAAEEPAQAGADDTVQCGDGGQHQHQNK